MRKELQELELLDQYLDGELSVEDKIAFEKRLEQEAVLKQALKDQIDLRKGIDRIQLLKEIQAAKGAGGSGGSSLFNSLGTTIIIVIGAIISYFFLVLPESREDLLAKSVQNSESRIDIRIPSQTEAKDVRKDSIRSEKKKEQKQLKKPKRKKQKKVFKKFDVETQKFKINGGEESTIVGKNGTKIIFPDSAFEVKGKIEIRLKEYNIPGEIVLAGLTTTSHGRAIETAGMIDISAYSKGRKVQLANDALYEIEFPDRPSSVAQYKIFYGNHTDSTVNWNVDPNYVFFKLNYLGVFKDGNWVNKRTKTSIRGEKSRQKGFGTNKAEVYASKFDFDTKAFDYLSSLLVIPNIAVFMEVEEGELKDYTVKCKDEYVKDLFEDYLDDMDPEILRKENGTYTGKFWIDNAIGYYPIEQIEFQAKAQRNKQVLKDLPVKLYATRLGSINCDTFARLTSDPNTFQVNAGFKGTALMIFKGRNIYLDPTFQTGNKSFFDNIPENTPAAILVYDQVGNNKYKVSLKQLRVTNEPVLLDEIKIMTEKELIEEINRFKA